MLLNMKVLLDLVFDQLVRLGQILLKPSQNFVNKMTNLEKNVAKL